MPRQRIVVVFALTLLSLVVITLAVLDRGVIKREHFIRGKRDADGIFDEYADLLPKGGFCVTDDMCAPMERCDLSDLSNTHCVLRGWVFALGIGGILLLLASFTATCLCCPCCLLYSLCRKG